MAERVSALSGQYVPGVYGKVGVPQVQISEVADLLLMQVAAWPDTLDESGRVIANAAGSSDAPGPCAVIRGTRGALLRVEPLKWWIVGGTGELVQDLQASAHCIALDISHSRTHVRISGEASRLLLNRHLPLDLRPEHCSINTVYSTVFHHVGITVWRSDEGWELFLPRAFAMALFELLCQSAEQFGYELC